MFDCVAPARIARHGTVYSRAARSQKKYRINIFILDEEGKPSARFKQLYKNRDSIVLLRIEDHYEVLARGKADLQTIFPFDDPFIKKIYNFVKN
mgnify:FL=1